MRFDLNDQYINGLGFTTGVGNALIEAANEIHDVFKDIAPRDTGTLVRTSYTTLEGGKGSWVAYVRTPAENERGTKYGKFVEFGTRRMRAQHNLLHAILAVERATK